MGRGSPRRGSPRRGSRKKETLKLIEHIKTHNTKSRCRNPSNTYAKPPKFSVPSFRRIFVCNLTIRPTVPTLLFLLFTPCAWAACTRSRTAAATPQKPLYWNPSPVPSRFVICFIPFRYARRSRNCSIFKFGKT